MSVYIKEITIINFKSFKGTHHIVFDKVFNVICGNKGKTSFLEAIRFAFGETKYNLCVHDLKDLIHRTADPAVVSVAVTLVTESGTEKLLRRSFEEAGTETFWIDLMIVPPGTYYELLREYKILWKCSTQSMAMGDFGNKSFLERTELIEQVSGSSNLKNDYERLRIDLDVAKAKRTRALKEWSAMGQQRLDLEKQIKNRQQFEQMKLELEDKYSTWYLFRLFHLEQEINSLEASIAEQNISEDQLQLQFIRLKNSAKEFQNSIAELSEALDKLEHSNFEIFKQQDKLKLLGIELLKIRNPSAIFEKQKLAIQEKIEEIQKNLRGKEAQESKFLEFSSKNPGTNEIQENFDDLQQEFEITHPFHWMKSELLKEDLEQKRRFLEIMIQPKLKELSSSLEEKTWECQKINHVMTAQRLFVDSKKTLLEQVDSELTESEAEKIQLIQELEKIQSKIFQENLKKPGNLEVLKMDFVGKVFDRLSKHCEPSLTEEIEKALKSILATAWDAIVVENADVAEDCMTYSLDRYMEIQRFMTMDEEAEEPMDQEPIGNIQQVSIREVINQTQPAEIKEAILACPHFLNVIFTNTLENAWKLASNSPRASKMKFISLDGTIVDRLGVESGFWNLIEDRATKELFEAQIDLEKKIIVSELAMKFSKIKIWELKKVISKVNLDLVAFNGQKLEVDQEVAKIEDELKFYRAESEKHSEFYEVARGSFQEFQPDFGLLETLHFQEFCQLLEIPNIQFYRDFLKRDVLALDIQKDLVELKLLGLELSQQNEKIESANMKNGQLQELKNRFNQELDVLKLGNSGLIEGTNHTSAEMLGNEANFMGKLTDYLDTSGSYIEKSQIQSDSRIKLFEKIREFLKILFDSKLTAVEIPVVSGSVWQLLEDLNEEFEIDYESLSNRLRGLTDPLEVEEVSRNLLKSIKLLEKKMQKLTLPSENHHQQMEKIAAESRTLKSRKDFLGDKKRMAQQKFDQVKTERTTLFRNACNEIEIFMNQYLVGFDDNFGVSIISLNDDEPYLGGTELICAWERGECSFQDLPVSVRYLFGFVLFLAAKWYQKSPIVLLDQFGVDVQPQTLEILSNGLKRQNFVQVILTSNESVLLKVPDCVISLMQQESSVPGVAETTVKMLRKP